MDGLGESGQLHRASGAGAALLVPPATTRVRIVDTMSFKPDMNPASRDHEPGSIPGLPYVDNGWSRAVKQQGSL
jgi:hypothetical protein